MARLELTAIKMPKPNPLSILAYFRRLYPDLENSAVFEKNDVFLTISYLSKNWPKTAIPRVTCSNQASLVVNKTKLYTRQRVTQSEAVFD